MDEQTSRWTDVELLPEWDEEFYDVYTAKKFGKWVMIKTLKPEFRDMPEYRAMIEKEFDTRYNLAHPNIVMINDFEEIPGLGRCIVTDDVYGDSLRKLIDQGPRYRGPYKPDEAPACQCPGVYSGEPHRPSSAETGKYNIHRKYRQSETYRRGLRTATLAESPRSGRRYLQLRQGS